MRLSPRALSWLHQPDLLLAGTITLLALGARLTWALYSQADPTDGRFDDSVFYHVVGASLAEGGGYNSPFTFLPTAQWPPGYPAFLAGLYTIFGVSVVAAKVANALLGALSVAALYTLGRQLFDRPSAATGALLLAVMPGQVFFTGLVWSEVLFTFLYLSALVAVALLPKRPARERLALVAAVGLLIAASAYVREAGLSLLPIALLYWGWSFRSWRWGLRWAGAAALLVALLIAPWAMRNAVQLDGLIVLSSSTGANFWRGHHEGATGGPDLIEPLLARSKPRTEPGGEADISRQGMRDGLTFLIQHPLKEPVLVRQKLRLLYQGDTIGLDLAEDRGRQRFIASGLRGALERLADGIYYAVLALAGLAMVRWAVQRDRRPLLPAIAIAFLTLGYVAFWAGPRLHFPIVPLFCLLAGWALASLWQARSQLLHMGR